jgi:hypothetical protein
VDFVERGMVPGSVGRIPRPLPVPTAPLRDDVHHDENGGADDDGGATESRDIIGEVVLAQTPSEFTPL